MPYDAIGILILVFLAACSSAAETALFSIGKIRLRTLAARQHPKAILVEKLRANPRRLLGTILVFNNVVTISTSALVTAAAIRAFGDIAVGIATGAVAFFIIIFGEFLPKSFGAHQPERVGFALVRPVLLVSRVIGPVVTLLERGTNRFFKFAPEDKKALVSEEEIKTMISMGAEAGAIEKGEQELIERVFLFNDITAEDVMTPKEQITFLDAGQSLLSALGIVNRSKFSRFPVFEGDHEKIVGVVHIKEILETVVEKRDASGSMPVMEIAAPAYFVPATKPIDDLFREFQKSHVHMAVVVNEYGSVLGLITIDDLLEELVGEISDESDIDEHIVKRVDKLTIVAHGDADIRVINRFFNVKINAPANKTLGWLLMERSGAVPQEGQRIAIQDNLTALVENMDDRRIVKVRLSKSAEPANPAQG